MPNELEGGDAAAGSGGHGAGCRPLQGFTGCRSSRSREGCFWVGREARGHTAQRAIHFPTGTSVVPASSPRRTWAFPSHTRTQACLTLWQTADYTERDLLVPCIIKCFHKVLPSAKGLRVTPRYRVRQQHSLRPAHRCRHHPSWRNVVACPSCGSFFLSASLLERGRKPKVRCQKRPCPWFGRGLRAASLLRGLVASL